MLLYHNSCQLQWVAQHYETLSYIIQSPWYLPFCSRLLLSSYTYIKAITHASLTRYECTEWKNPTPQESEPGTPASCFKLSRCTTYFVTASPNDKKIYIKKCVLRTCFTLASYIIYIGTYVPICSLVSTYLRIPTYINSIIFC